MRSEDRKVNPLPSAGRNVAKPAMLAALDRLVQLRHSMGYATVGPPEKIDGRDVVPMKLLVDGEHRATTYFDASTHLPVKEVKLYLPDVRKLKEGVNQKAATETTYQDHKSYDGVVLPVRMTAVQGGQRLLDITLLDVQFPSQLDAGLFEKPDER